MKWTRTITWTGDADVAERDVRYETPDGYLVTNVQGRSPWAVSGPDMARTAYAKNLTRAAEIIEMARRGDLSFDALFGRNRGTA